MTKQTHNGYMLVFRGTDWHKGLSPEQMQQIADTWMAHHDNPPVLEGQTFQYVPSPNRYGLPAHFELHVWAWRNNPNGAFVDWNDHVTCNSQ